VIVPMTFQELLAARAYKNESTGKPSSNSGTPADVHGKQPPSSTKSGGPG
jgi:hypothetical protein